MKTFTKAIAVFLFFMGSAQLVSAQAAYKVKSSGGANLRQGPATGKEVITTIPAGAKLKVVEKNNDGWYKVEYNGKTGYVSSSLVEEDNNQSNPSSTSANNSRSNDSAQKSNSNASQRPSNSSSQNKNSNKSSAAKSSGSSNAYKWGIGLRLGEPLGVSVKKYNSNNTAWEVNLGRASRWGHHYNGDDFYKHDKYDNRDMYKYYGYYPGFTTALQVRYLWSKPISGADGLSFYYGGGIQTRFTPVRYRYMYYYNNDRDWEYREDRVTDIDLGLDGVLGLEYMMKDIPLSFFLDVNLFVEIIDAPFVIYPQGGAGIRYNF
ncbi:SH3 domain-containing protein [Rhodocytophaga aerolata]|uniref:SH3 domain-containing protein n=1 Tax=Rhodocytophaga aerolata TaxID=455078 RepID=A0ABT8R9V2_9BACT|nr:SH3 domain-containing protein [Rhodocytophaga aerolata]MDO1447988.1 SH3 domain-containing protein [Rhodocytophaga aerolata]